jgi:hypothetical protein
MRRNIYFNEENDKLLVDLAKKMDLPMGEVIAIGLKTLSKNNPDQMDIYWNDFKSKIKKALK